MDEQFIKEGNNVLIEFMGGTYHESYNDGKMKSTEPCYVFDKAHGFIPFSECGNRLVDEGEIDFHSSWDWLMPVIEKLHHYTWAAYDNFRKVDRYDLERSYKVCVGLIKHTKKLPELINKDYE